MAYCAYCVRRISTHMCKVNLFLQNTSTHTLSEVRPLQTGLAKHDCQNSHTSVLPVNFGQNYSFDTQFGQKCRLKCPKSTGKTRRAFFDTGVLPPFGEVLEHHSGFSPENRTFNRAFAGVSPGFPRGSSRVSPRKSRFPGCFFDPRGGFHRAFKTAVMTL